MSLDLQEPDNDLGEIKHANTNTRFYRGSFGNPNYIHVELRKMELIPLGLILSTVLTTNQIIQLKKPPISHRTRKYPNNGISLISPKDPIHPPIFYLILRENSDLTRDSTDNTGIY